MYYKSKKVELLNPNLPCCHPISPLCLSRCRATKPRPASFPHAQFDWLSCDHSVTWLVNVKGWYETLLLFILVAQSLIYIWKVYLILFQKGIHTCYRKQTSWLLRLLSKTKKKKTWNHQHLTLFCYSTRVKRRILSFNMTETHLLDSNSYFTDFFCWLTETRQTDRSIDK